MTDWEKEQVEELRKYGKSYGWIAAELGIPKDTIKSYCRRHGFTGYGKKNVSEEIINENIVRCRQCGAVVLQNPGRKKKQYCSDACRMKWWNSHMSQVDKKANYEITCANCGKVFISYGNAERKYCSHECYIEDRFGKKIITKEPEKIGDKVEPVQVKKPMKKDQFDSELNFAATMHIAKRMMKEGIINTTEYNSIRKKMVEKYDPKIGELLYDEVKENE